MTAPKRRCELCACWQSGRVVSDDQTNQLKLVNDRGECRAEPPRDGHRWSVTYAGDWCVRGFTPKEDACPAS